MQQVNKWLIVDDLQYEFTFLVRYAVVNQNACHLAIIDKVQHRIHFPLVYFLCQLL